MGIARGVCRICGARFETSYDEATEDTAESKEILEWYIVEISQSIIQVSKHFFEQFRLCCANNYSKKIARCEGSTKSDNRDEDPKYPPPKGLEKIQQPTKTKGIPLKSGLVRR